MLPSFVPIATFDDYEVYVGEPNNWAVQHGPHWCDTPALQVKASLLWLPLLEHDYLAVREALAIGLTNVNSAQAAQRLTTFPAQHLVRLALTSRCSWYWVDLALRWASHLELEPDLQRAVRALALDRAVPQPTRHRAKRLYYTGKV
jgi:hypothetical protein